MAETYLPVPVDDLVGMGALDFDIYVQLNAKHILYMKRGHPFDEERLLKIRKKNVKSLYITVADEERFHQGAVERLNDAYDFGSSTPAEIRLARVSRSQTDAADKLIKNFRDPYAYEKAMSGAKRFTELMLRDDKALGALLAVPNTDRSIGAHGVAVAGIALALAKKLGMGEMRDLHLLTLGCMIHDAGHFGLDAGFGQPVKSLLPNQLKARREHTVLGARATQELVQFDQHVLSIILEHEEYVDGTGFPNGLVEKQMHVFTVIASTANSFDHIRSFEGETTLQGTMKRMIVDKIGRHPLEHINALKSIISTL